jgi:hypothetical protein
MKGADMFMLKKNDGSSSTNGAPWQLVDSYAAGFEMPVPDQHDDLKLLSASSSQDSNSYTAAVMFQRRLVPCDEQDLPILLGTPGYVIWAFGDTYGQYHGQHKRGSKVLTLAPLPASETAGAGAANKRVRRPNILGAFQDAALDFTQFMFKGVDRRSLLAENLTQADSGTGNSTEEAASTGAAAISEKPAASGSPKAGNCPAAQAIYPPHKQWQPFVEGQQPCLPMLVCSNVRPQYLDGRHMEAVQVCLKL